MDGRTLMEIMQSPNFSMWGPSEQAFNLGQKKSEADLQTALGNEQRAKALHPLDVQTKQASIRQSDAAAGYNNALSGKLQDELKVLEQIPIDERVRSHVAKMKADLSGNQLVQTDAEMTQLLGAASAAAKNGGQLPLGYTLQNPQHANYFKSPKGSQLAMQIARSYFDNKPTELAAVAKDARHAASAAQVANIGLEGTKYRADKTAQRQQLKIPTTNTGAVYYYQRLAELADDEQEKAALIAKSEAAQKAHEADLIQKAILAWQTAQGGKPAVGQMSGIPVNPSPGQAPSRNTPAPTGTGKPGDPIVLK